jgi:hypothetical protein
VRQGGARRASFEGAAFSVEPLAALEHVLIQIKEHDQAARQACIMQWQPIESAPFDLDLELAVIDRDGPHALAFACRRSQGGWIGAQTRRQIEVRPTHWREWKQD